ncbi:MAG: hypothetical protein CVV49_13780 [Spirochaetae bacterium HGW-Spirochaetae-5]|nr:MAG: hypothetical protein CVV49_13780 [Spirochaetae bacterium HGW-Spirochaetae-5]
MKKGLNFISLIIITSSLLILVCQKGGSSADSQYSKIDSSGVITVSVQPVMVSNSSIEFSVTFSTHSVPLDQFDLKQLITLKTDDGEIHPYYVPDFSSHHGSGSVIFKLVKPVKTIYLTVRNIPDNPERIFKWDLK